jgi:hypothetical protein
MRDDEPADGVVLLELRRGAEPDLTGSALGGDQLPEAGLLTRGGVPMDEPVLRGAIEQGLGGRKGLIRVFLGCGATDLFHGGAKGGRLAPVEGFACA